MALGLLLCVSWIGFLLFDCSAGLPKDQGYHYKADLHNHDALASGVSDQRDWKDSNKLLAPYHTSYNAPSAPQWQGSVRSLQNQPKTQRSAEVQRLVNGRPRDWSQDDPAKELVFPLRSSYRQTPSKPQPGPVHTLYQSGNTGYSSNDAGLYDDANYMSTGASPSAPQQGSFPSKQSNVGTQPFYPSRLGRPSSPFYSEKDPNSRSLNYRQQTPVVGTQNVALNQKVSEPIRPPTYIVQSRNGYQRASYLQSKSRYSPPVPLQRGV